MGRISKRRYLDYRDAALAVIAQDVLLNPNCLGAWNVAKTLTSQEVGSTDIGERKQAFLNALRKYLIELRHSEITDNNAARLTFDEQYVPYFDNRRLRSLGSASDHSRLTTAYTLALAATGTRPTGLHPGIVLLDEPLQQNPDPGHRSRFLQFLSRELARTAAFQTIIFTSLTGEEVARLRKQNVKVQTPVGKKWLKPVPPPEPPK